jgi:hypothetical protein
MMVQTDTRGYLLVGRLALVGVVFVAVQLVVGQAWASHEPGRWNLDRVVVSSESAECIDAGPAELSLLEITHDCDGVDKLEAYLDSCEPFVCTDDSLENPLTIYEETGVKYWDLGLNAAKSEPGDSVTIDLVVRDGSERLGTITLEATVGAREHKSAKSGCVCTDLLVPTQPGY